MATNDFHAEPVSASKADEDIPATHAVTFPNDDEQHEEKIESSRPKGVEMDRTMTQEHRDLAAAGYEHLEEKKDKKDKSEFENVDIYEHALSFDELSKLHRTNFDAKDPAQSVGLTDTEANARSARDGKNILTPHKKKSALRKVCLVAIHGSLLLTG